MARYSFAIFRKVALLTLAVEFQAQAYTRIGETPSDAVDAQFSKMDTLGKLLFAADPVRTHHSLNAGRRNIIKAPHRLPARSNTGAVRMQSGYKGSKYAEASREYRRTVYMHKEWVKHRSSQRFIRNLQTLGESGVQQALGQELTFITGAAVFAVAINMLLGSYVGLDGVEHAGALAFLGKNIAPVAIPGMAYTIANPALGLLLVFRTNTAYFRWNEARTLWGGVVNNCRNVVRQANVFFPGDAASEDLKTQLAGNTALFCKALRNFLRGPSDDATFRADLMEFAAAGIIPLKQVDACMAAKNRPMFMLNAMSETVRKANIDVISKQSIDRSISTLVDLTGACERIFKSPVPLVYTRHTSRFLTLFLLLLPFGLWKADDSWNHLLTIPMTDLIAFFLLGIEEIGIQLEEPFSVLPLEALCNGAIAAVLEELMEQKRADSFHFLKK
mmetsp:Transcript_115493/g.182629  ORF Transcript_115493/g.182629 Transcript_115493/m.182629 type:complete len:445 (-) Transcript_115493:224-1558(-)